MAIFRLLHITDLHIAIPPEDNQFGRRTLWEASEAVYPSHGNRYALDAIAEFVSEHRSSADLILLSGDVADDGVERNLDAAYRYITTPATDDWFVRDPFAPTLDAGRTSGPLFFILPGNHDRFQVNGRTPGGTAFDAKFEEYWHAGLGGVQSVLLPPKQNTTLALIAADFCLRSAGSGTVYLGQGHAYEDVVDALVRQTREVRAASPKAGIVWISHFPPLLNVDHSLKLWGAIRLLNEARRNGISHVIAGHLHRNQVNTYADVEVICTGTASCTGAGELHGYWIQLLDIDVEPDGGVSIALTKYRYKPLEARFVRQRR
jgi:3',5'-cyclic AMP phosphodiesterase CpdA